MHKEKEKPAPDDEKQKADNSAQLAEIMKGLPNLINDAVTKGFGNAFANIPSKQPKDEDEDEGEDAPASNDVDYEKMTRKDLVEHITSDIIGAVSKQLKGFGKDINDEIISTKRVISKESLVRELKEVQDKYPEFNDFREEVGALAKQYKNLAVEDLFLLAKSKNPDKLKEIDTKKQKIQDQENQKNKRLLISCQ